MIRIVYHENAEDLDSKIVKEWMGDANGALINLIDRLIYYPRWPVWVEKIEPDRLVLKSESMEPESRFTHFAIVYTGDEVQKLGAVAAWFAKFHGSAGCSSEIYENFGGTVKEFMWLEDALPSIYSRP